MVGENETSYRISASSDSRLTDGQYNRIFLTLAEMVCDGEEKGFVSGDDFHGIIYAEEEPKRKTFLIGKRFVAELIDSRSHNINIELIVENRTFGAPGTPSLN